MVFCLQNIKVLLTNFKSMGGDKRFGDPWTPPGRSSTYNLQTTLVKDFELLLLRNTSERVSKKISDGSWAQSYPIYFSLSDYFEENYN